MAGHENSGPQCDARGGALIYIRPRIWRPRSVSVSRLARNSISPSLPSFSVVLIGTSTRAGATVSS